MNFSILLYLSLRIKSDSSVSYIRDFGMAVYSIVNIADLASVIQMCYPGFIYLIPRYSPYYKNNYNNLFSIKDEINLNYDTCEAYETLSSDFITMYSIKDNKQSTKKTNFINYLNSYLITVFSI